jgi:sugar lactone lactonase YvrE
VILKTMNIRSLATRFSKVLAGVALAVIAAPTLVAAQIITTFAGGETGPALLTPVSTSGVAVDPAGNVFIADELNHRVRKVTPAGVMTTVAGTGEAGFNMDNIPAANALLNFPRGVALDANGNLFIADRVNNRIRKVSPAGLITTIAGTGLAGYSGDGGPAANAALNGPVAVAVSNGGEVFFSDFRNNRVRRVSIDGNISTFAGTGASGFGGDGVAAVGAQLNGPIGLAVDAGGNVYFSDQSNHRVRRVATDGTISTFAGTGVNGFSGDSGAASSASLSFPSGLTIDSQGRLYIADGNNDRIRRVSLSGTIATIAGSGIPGFSGDGGLAVTATLRNPADVAIDSAGNLYIADVSNARVRKVSSAGVISSIAGNGLTGYGIGDGAAATSATLSAPAAVAFDATGNLYVADFYKHRVRKVTPSGTISTVAGTGTPGSAGDGGAAANAQLYLPSGLVFDTNGNLYVAEFGGHRVRKINAAGIISTFAGTGSASFGGDGGAAVTAGLNGPRGLAVDAAGYIYIADRGNHRIRRVNSIGTISTFAGDGTNGFGGDSGPATLANLASPSGISVDSAGSVWIADSGNHRIRRVTLNGVISTFAGTGVAGFSGDNGMALGAQLHNPVGVKFDAAGNAYVSDYGNNRIRKIKISGIISTIAGNGMPGFAGDNGVANVAAISHPYDAAVDAPGNLYVADSGNDRIRKIFLRPVLADFTADTKSDILYKDASGAVNLALMNGLSVTATANILAAGSGWSATHIADFNGDGKADLLIKNTDGRIAVLLMNGASVIGFAEITEPGSGFNAVVTADFNADDKADIVLKGVDGASSILLMNGTNIIARSVVITAGSTWSVTHTGDFNSDGKSDLVLRSTDGSAAILMMDGVNVTNASLLLTPGSPWTITHVVDLNGDAKSDLVIKNTDGSVALLLMNGTTVSAANFLLLAGSPYTVTQAGDFNGDGKTDLTIRHTDGSVVILLMNGTAVSAASFLLTAGSPLNIALVADFNGDGKSDVLLRNSDGSAIAALMDGTTVTAFGNVWAAGTSQVVP